MKKRISLLMITFIACITTFFAGAQDVTNQYLTNPGFNVTGDFVEDNFNSAITPVTKDVTGWELIHAGAWSMGGVFELGTTYQLNTSPIPQNGPDDSTNGGVLGISSGWENTVTFTQAVILPEGKYQLIYDVYNAGSNARGKSLAGWIYENGTSALSTKNSFATGVWEKDTVEFLITDLKKGKIQIGFQSVNAGSLNNAKPCFDNVKLKRVSYPEKLLEAASLLTEAAIKGDNNALNDVRTNLTLPTMIGEGISILWTSSKPDVVSPAGEVIVPKYYGSGATLTATLGYTENASEYTIEKTFYVVVPAKEGITHVARWDFSNKTLYMENDTIKVKSLDANGDPVDGYTGTVMNDALIKTIGKSGEKQFNVLSLGNSNGYFDMGAEVGKAAYHFENFTIMNYFRIHEDYTEIDKAGNYLFSFSNTDNAGRDRNGYLIGRFSGATNVTCAEKYWGDGDTRVLAQSKPSQGEWHHFMYRQEGRTGVLYIDGIEVARNEVMNVPSETFALPDQEGTLHNYIGRAVGQASDVNLRQTLVYDFQVLNFPVDIHNSFLEEITENISDLNAAYQSEPNYIPGNLQEALKNIVLHQDRVSSSFTLPTVTDSEISVSWSSSIEEFITIIENPENMFVAQVIRPRMYDAAVTLTVSVTKGVQTLSKTFDLTVASMGEIFENELLVHYDFSEVNDRTVTDQAEKHFKGTLMNEASVKTLKFKDGEEINALDFGNGTGYFDMGVEIGQIIYHTYDYTMSAYYYMDENYPDINQNGNFLWAFSNSADNGNMSLNYILKDQRLSIRSSASADQTLRAYGENRNAEKGTWHHVAYTQFANVGTIYIDGVKMTEGDVGIPAEVLRMEGRSGTLFNWLGRSPFPSDVYLRESMVADFRFYSRALDEYEINDLGIEKQLDKLNNEQVVSLREVKENQYKVFVNNNRLVIENLSGSEKVTLYSLSGQQYPLNSLLHCGVYIVRINDHTMKLVVK